MYKAWYACGVHIHGRTPQTPVPFLPTARMIPSPSSEGGNSGSRCPLGFSSADGAAPRDAAADGSSTGRQDAAVCPFGFSSSPAASVPTDTTVTVAAVGAAAGAGAAAAGTEAAVGADAPPVPAVCPLGFSSGNRALGAKLSRLHCSLCRCYLHACCAAVPCRHTFCRCGRGRGCRHWYKFCPKLLPCFGLQTACKSCRSWCAYVADLISGSTQLNFHGAIHWCSHCGWCILRWLCGDVLEHTLWGLHCGKNTLQHTYTHTHTSSIHAPFHLPLYYLTHPLPPHFVHHHSVTRHCSN